MGRAKQKRIVRKLDLERMLAHVNMHPSPQPGLEQYTIPPDVAANVLYLAAYVRDDIVGRTVIDLGCGTGRLALGAAFLGASKVIGIDLDKVAIRTASENATALGLKGRVHWVVGDIDAIRGRVDTVLQNPPFGVQRRTADRKFVERAVTLGRAVYSLHMDPRGDSPLIRSVKSSKTGALLTSPLPFLERFVSKVGGRIVAVFAMVMTIPHMFSFHTRKRYEFLVDLYVIASDV